MAVSFTSADLARVDSAAAVLAAPFDYATPHAWLGAACEAARDAVGAAVATAVLPTGGAPISVGPAYDRSVLDWYTSYFPLLEETGVLRRMGQGGVVTRREAYGPHYDALQRSPYVQEFLATIRAYDSIALSVMWAPDAVGYRDIFQMLVTVDDPARPIDEAQVGRARLLYPALRAGAEVFRRLRRAYANVGALIDATGAACAVYDHAGQLVHATPGLGDALTREPRRDDLMACARAVALQAAERSGGADAAFAGARGHYALAASHVRTLDPRPLVLVTVEAPAKPASLPSPGALAERSGLTRRQAEAALLLARRHSNREVAAALGVSVHTARHHVEGVLAKLDVSRSEVPRVVRQLGADEGRTA